MLRRTFGGLQLKSASSLLFPGLNRPAFGAIRAVSTEHLSPAQEQDILVRQRKNRPTSPHLDIYKPQLTWYLSGLHRITGVGLAFALYGGLVGYALGPLVGLPWTVADLASVWSTMPTLLKVATKSLIAFPFSFHSLNGVRHLVWDTVHEMTIPGVYRTGYVVLGLSVVMSVALALL